MITEIIISRALKFCQRCALLTAACALVGCVSLDNRPRPLTDSPLAQPGDSLLFNDWEKYKGERLASLMKPGLCGPTGKKTVFFVTLSGGGSRAAYMAARVLHELDKVGERPMTNSIDAVFSVSGGSLAAALFANSRDPDAANGDGNGGSISSAAATWQPWTEAMTESVLSKPLATTMAAQLANPLMLSEYLFGGLSRTDLLERAIEQDILGSVEQPLRFGALNPARPPIFIVATLATSEGAAAFAPRPFGSVFIFSPANLAQLGIDPDSVPVARAIAASAAFPGLLSPLALPRYRRSVYEAQLGSPRYVHLIDGGNADNLGLLGVKRALLEDQYRLLRECDNIVVLSVDAFGRQGQHSDLVANERASFGWLFDVKSTLASFDALLAANRARLLAEFKSRVFMPPGDETLCEKDGLPDDICGGGVRADWDEINVLLKRKLFFIHLGFDSPELVSQTSATHCDSAWPTSGPANCKEGPVDGARLLCEKRALVKRVREIPTKFGLDADESADIKAFVSLLNHPKNACLQHLRDILVGGVPHEESFYSRASASCDATPNLKIGQIPIVAGDGHVRGRIVGDVTPFDRSKLYVPFSEFCKTLPPGSEAESVSFLYDAKSKLVRAPRYLD